MSSKKFPLIEGYHYGDLTVLGTLRVEGHSILIEKVDNVEVTDMNITENVITLNAGEQGSEVTMGTAGIKIDRGSAPSYDMMYDEENHWIEVGDHDKTLFPLATYQPETMSGESSDDNKILIWDTAGKSIKALNGFSYTDAGGLIVGTGAFAPVVIESDEEDNPFTLPTSENKAYELAGDGLLVLDSSNPADVRRRVLIGGTSFSCGETGNVDGESGVFTPTTTLLATSHEHLMFHARSTIELFVGPTPPEKTDVIPQGHPGISIRDNGIVTQNITSLDIDARSIKIGAPSSITSLVTYNKIAPLSGSEIGPESISFETQTSSMRSGIQKIISVSRFIGSGREHEFAFTICSKDDWSIHGYAGRLVSARITCKNLTNDSCWPLPTYKICTTGDTDEQKSVLVNIDTESDSQYEVVIELNMAMEQLYMTDLI